MKTILDVAKAANVSVATVSKVFNGYKDVGNETRERVLRLAEELDYFPNRNASQLVNRKEDTVCVIFSAFGAKTSKDEYLVGLLSGIYYEANKNNLRVVVFTPDAILSNNQNYVQFCRSNNLIGFVVHGLDIDDPKISHLVESEVPCVFIDSNITGKRTATVSVNNRFAAKEITDKLIGLGHRNIAFVAGVLGSDVTKERMAGYEKSMKENKQKVQIILGDFIYETAYQNVRNYLIENPETTAFFCASDIMAVGAMNACLDLKFKVPDDISIIGFDNTSFTSYTRPRISTIGQDFYSMGVTSTKVLLSLFEDKETETRTYVDYQIQLRESVAKNNN